MLKRKQNWYSMQTILQNISMNKHSTLVINNCHYITCQRNILGYYINYGGIQHNLVHVLSHGPTHKICLVRLGIIFSIQNIKELFVNLVLQQ
jgi:hypothetical protein